MYKVKAIENPYVSKGACFQKIVLKNKTNLYKYNYLSHIWLIWLLIYKTTVPFLLRASLNKLWLDYYYSYNNVFKRNLYLTFMLGKSTDSEINTLAGFFYIRSFKGQARHYKFSVDLPKRLIYYSKHINMRIYSAARFSPARGIDTSFWASHNSDRRRRRSIKNLIKTNLLLIDFFNNKFDAICKNSKKVKNLKNLTEDQSDIVMRSSRLPFILITFEQFVLKQGTHLWLLK